MIQTTKKRNLVKSIILCPTELYINLVDSYICILNIVVSIKVEGKEKKIKNKDGEEDEDFDEDEENVCITPTKSISKKNKRVIQDDEEAEESSEPKKKISKSSNSKISKEGKLKLIFSCSKNLKLKIYNLSVLIFVESPLTKALQINRSKPNAVKLGTAKTFVYILKFKNNIIGLSLNGWWLDLREHISKPNTNYILKTGKVIKCKFNFYYIPHKDITEIHNKALIEANETNYKIGPNISKLWLKDGILSGFNRLVFAPSAHFVPGIYLQPYAFVYLTIFLILYRFPYIHYIYIF